jgi:hypothetical protein
MPHPTAKRLDDHAELVTLGLWTIAVDKATLWTVEVCPPNLLRGFSMALSDGDKKEMTELFADAVASGLGKFQSQLEEAKAKAAQDKGSQGGNDNGGQSGNSGGFSFAEWVLGGSKP